MIFELVNTFLSRLTQVTLSQLRLSSANTLAHPIFPSNVEKVLLHPFSKVALDVNMEENFTWQIDFFVLTSIYIYLRKKQLNFLSVNFLPKNFVNYTIKTLTFFIPLRKLLFCCLNAQLGSIFVSGIVSLIRRAALSLDEFRSPQLKSLLD